MFYFIILFLLIIIGLLILHLKLLQKEESLLQEDIFCDCRCKEIYLTEIGSLAEWVCACCGKPKKTEDI